MKKAQQVYERTRPLMREVDRLSGRFDWHTGGRIGIVSKTRAAETIINHVRTMKRMVKKEQEKSRKEVLKKMKKSLGVANIKEVLQARLLYCPHYIITYEAGKTEILDHNGKRVKRL